jgi:hypothetical protein
MPTAHPSTHDAMETYMAVKVNAKAKPLREPGHGGHGPRLAAIEGTGRSRGLSMPMSTGVPNEAAQAVLRAISVVRSGQSRRVRRSIRECTVSRFGAGAPTSRASSTGAFRSASVSRGLPAS